MKSFKVGERVCCYGQNQTGTFDVINEDGDYGTVVGAIGPTGVEVKMDNDYMEGRVCTFHPRQLVRLVKKKRLTVFIHRNELVENFKTGNGVSAYPDKWNDPDFDIKLDDFIEFREVKRPRSG